MPTIGEGAVEATAAESVEVNPGGDATADFVMGVVAKEVFLAVSAVVFSTCLAATPDVSAAGSAGDEAAGEVVEALARRLANVR